MNRQELINRLNAREPLLCLAPLAEITHAAFRLLVEQYGGCDLYFTEMISAAAHLKGGPLEHYYTDPAPDPGKVIYQLVGSDPEALTEAAHSLSRFQPAGIDINMGCSAPEIIKQGGGCAWMREPRSAASLIGMIRNRIPEEITLSVKLRLGEQENAENLISFCRDLVAAGTDFITLHPKTRKEKHSRPPRWDYVRILVEALNVPVIGNGHLTTPDIALTRLNQSGCHGLMIGRQAVAEPWIFQLIHRKLKGDRTSFTIDLLDVIESFIRLLELHQPEEFHRTRAILFSAWFQTNLFWGFRFHHTLITKITRPKELREHYYDYFERYPEERYRTLPRTFDRQTQTDYNTL